MIIDYGFASRQIADHLLLRRCNNCSLYQIVCKDSCKLPHTPARELTAPFDTFEELPMSVYSDLICDEHGELKEECCG